jgi:hypothetical protein
MKATPLPPPPPAPDADHDDLLVNVCAIIRQHMQVTDAVHWPSVSILNLPSGTVRQIRVSRYEGATGAVALDMQRGIGTGDAKFRFVILPEQIDREFVVQLGHWMRIGVNQQIDLLTPRCGTAFVRFSPAAWAARTDIDNPLIAH